MSLGEFVAARRKELGYSRNKLGEMTGISHTEVFRIENGERANPSMKVIANLAKALGVSQDELLKAAGLKSNETTDMEKAFPHLTTDKQKETVGRIADGLSRNADLRDEDLDDLYRQVEMFIDYAKKKRDSE